jgi:cellulose synthase/poly-beta-1,6-N-acetylglucosamine synthase-like glycosyltransferase
MNKALQWRPFRRQTDALRTCVAAATSSGSSRSARGEEHAGGNRERSHPFGQLEDLRHRGLLLMPERDTAFTTFCRWQKLVLMVMTVAVVVSLIERPLATLVVVNTAGVFGYLVIVAFRFYTVLWGERLSGQAPARTSGGPNEPRFMGGDHADLPVYTILCPLYREANTVGQFLQGMAKLDYPFDKLDIRLLLEEDDLETQAAARAARERLGNCTEVQLIIVPNAPPKTKPKACNYGLQGARGEYVVIFDAEDIPEPDQLKKALAAFRRLPNDTGCVQAKLNYFNPTQNLLTRFFTAEYSMWFDLFLPGLFAVGSPIPLGGTSNHFKKEHLLALGGWDPFNVTEDADLGIRLARGGCRTAIIDSTTWEEANSRIGNWIRQRSRWIKGYMQVWLVGMRRPVSLLRALGPWRFFCFHAVVGGTPFLLLLNPVYWGLALVWAITAWGVVPQLFPQPVLAVSLMTGLLGNLMLIYLAIYGLLKREHYSFVSLMFLSPLYWVLQSIAAWKALYQLLAKPHYWEKTAHSLATLPMEEVDNGDAQTDLGQRSHIEIGRRAA